MTDNASQTHALEEPVRRELEALLSQPPLDGSNRLKRFLRYIIDETLEGRSARLSGYTIALDVFDKGEDFDPALDSVVRVEASRLRRRINQHYAETERIPDVKITLPKGTYVPTFERANVPDRPAPAPEAAPQTDRGPKVAVLPFKNYSTEPADQFFADGLTEETIANLSRFKGLFVISRSTTSKLAREGADVPKLREELGVDFVLEGSVRKSTQAVRVTAQLIDAQTDGHIFAESFDRPCTPEGVFEIQDEIALMVAARVGDRYGPLGRYLSKSRRAGTTQRWETYDLILRFYAYYATHDPELHLQVRDGLIEALSEDTDASDGWAALSVALLDEHRFHFNERPGVSALGDALDHALRAVSCDPENSFAHHALAIAYFHSQEFRDFRISAERCLELNPGHSDALADIGICYCLSGQWEEGLQLVERAIKLAPIHPGWFHTPFAAKHILADEYEDALVELSKGAMPGFYWYHALCVCALAAVGSRVRLNGELKELGATYPDFAKKARKEMSLMGFQADLAAKLLEGWQAAGLDVGEGVETATNGAKI